MNIIHEYFRKEFDGLIILVQLNPETFEGVELTITEKGVVEKRTLQFDEDIYEDLDGDEFTSSSPLEFNLHLKGVSG